MARQFVYGAEKLNRRLRTIRQGVSQIVQRTRLEEFMLRRIKQRFEKQLSPDLIPWATLSDGHGIARNSTIKRKERKYKAGQADFINTILKETEVMFNSIKVIQGSGSTEDVLASSTGAGFRIGIDDPEIVPRARAHQFGNQHVPQRQFLGISRLDVKAIDSLLRRELAKIVRLSAV